MPSDGFVVAGVVAQAAVQDADEPVGECPQGLVMSGAASPLGVVVGARSGRTAERGDRLEVESVGQPAVACRAGQHRPFQAGGAGDQSHAGVVFASLGVGTAVRVVSELGEHPGAQDRPEPGLAQVDLSVRVPAKTRLHLAPERPDLGDQGVDDGDQRAHRRGVGAHHAGMGLQLWGAQSGLDAFG